MATYTKNVWNSGDLITAGKMNQIENQLELVTPGSTNIASNYISGNYTVGDYCLYNGQLYRCTVNNAGTPPNGWVATSVMAETGSGVSDSIAQEFSTTNTYAVGDYVVFERKLYRCINAINTAGSWTSENWVEAILTKDIADLKNSINNIETACNNITHNTLELTEKTKVLDGKFQYHTPINWLDTTAITTGYYVKSDGTVTEASSQQYSDYIPVETNDKVRLFRGDTLVAVYRTHVCLYNSQKEVVPGGTDNAATTSFTIPEGVAFIRVSSANNITKPMIVRDGQTPAAYSKYFTPYFECVEDFLTVNSAEKLASLPDSIALNAVKGTNLIPFAETGTGAYYASGSKIVFNATGSYANYRYAVIPVRPNTLYSFNFVPHWFILATDEGVIVQSGTSKPGYFVETGNATKFYCTFDISVWINGGVIVAEGISGRKSGMIKPQFLSDLNQLVHDSWYAMALPPKAVRFTKDLQEKFYYDNILALDANFVTASFGGYGVEEDDGVVITPDSVNNGGNGYRYTVYDENLSVVQNNVNYTGTLYVYADNVQNCSALLIGDSTVAQNTMGQKLIDAFQAREKTITLLGTNGTGDNRHEGRAGWSTIDYIGGSTRGSDPTQNPFYNPTTESFDFSYYMQQQNYSAVDFVVIQLGINDLYNPTLGEARAAIDTTSANIFTMVDSILAFNASQKILLNLPTPCNGNSSSVGKHKRRTTRAKFTSYNALMQLLVTKYGSKVRCSNAHLVLDPMSDINDNIHPNATGYNKMALAILSQINAWQNT